MEYSVLFEVPFDVDITPWVAIASGAICLILAAIMLIFRRKLKFVAGLTLFFFAVMCLYISARGFIDFSDRMAILENYKNGNTYVSEGTITQYTENYNGKTNVDAFYVDGELFTVGNSNLFGYRYTKAYNGGLDNEKQVKITYVPHGYGVNVIMKIEVLN